MNHRFAILIGLIGFACIAFSHINWSKYAKVVKNVTYAQANVMLLIYLSFGMFDRVTFKAFSSIMSVGLFLLVIIFLNYFKGLIYRVADYPDVTMLPLILAALDASELHNYKHDSSEDGKIITVEVLGSNKVLTIETKQSFVSGQTYYLLSFKKWMHSKSRKSVLSHIRTALEQHTPIPQKTWTKNVEKGLTIALVLLILLYGNALIINPYKIELNYEGPLPEKLMVTRLDRRITDEKQHELIEIDKLSDIALFYESLRYLNTYSEGDVIFDDIASEDRMLEYTYTVTLDKPWRTLYVGPYKGYVTVNYNEMKKASLWYEWSVSIYQFFGGKDYAIYSFYSASDVKFVLDAILD